jgi:hypothetical protein
MRKVRDRAANGRGSRKARVLRSVEILEARCVLNAGPPTMMLGAPQPGGSSLHSDYGEYVAGPRGLSDPHFSLWGDAATARQAAGPMGFAEPPSASPLPGWPDPSSAARADSVMMLPMSVVGVPESRTGDVVIVERSVSWGAISSYIGGPMGTLVAGSHGEYDAYGASKTFAIPLPGVSLPTAHSYGTSLTIDVLPATSALPQSTASSQISATPPQNQVGIAAAGPSVAARAAIFELPAAAAQVHQAIVTADASIGLTAASDSTIQDGWLIVRNTSPVENRPFAVPNLTTVADRHRSTPAPALAGRSRTVGDATELPHESASLAGMTLDMHGVERALETVMSEIEVLGAGLTHWLDDVHFTRLAVATTAAALGVGSAYYRRRGAGETVRGDDEESLSWLFARLQPIPGE